MLNNKYRVSILSITLAILLGGCSSSHTSKYKEVDNNNEKIKQVFKEKRESFDFERDALLEVKEDFYVDTENFYLETKEVNNYPLIFREDISYISEKSMDSSEFSAEIYRLTGIKAQFLESTIGGSQSDGDESQVLNLDSILPISNSADSTGIISNSDSESSSKVDGSVTLKEFSYDGDLKGMLDYIAIVNGMKWNYDEKLQSVFFFTRNTEIFYVFEQDNEVSTTSKIEAESGSGNKQSIEFSKKEEVWESIEGNIESLLSENGKVSFNRAKGAVIVEDNDFILSKIGSFIDDLNDDVTREIVVKLSVMNVSLESGSNVKVDLNYLNNSLESSLLGDFAFDFTTSGSSMIAGSGVDGLAGASGAFRNGDGVEALFGMLSNVGSVSVETQQEMKTLNNKPITLQITDTEEYIKETEETLDNVSGRSSVNYTVDSLVDGMSIILTPRLIGDKVMVDYTFSILGANGFAPSPVNEVQLPRSSNKDITQSTIMKNGQTSVLLAYEYESNKSDSSGPLSDNLYLLGGSENADSSKELVVISMTTYFKVK
jgi:type IVB pilus formation R64 PilN family outer membrane protein